ncbi:MAG: hypothetical protein A2Z81_06320 [Omnitrophica WOR_2 bacterium GWA2_45_18]|nr:MAG: hypothetical protein A2Z81_06320 [Omnitrophica WOR_2 bacterium GWA2_45_18]
MLFDISSIFASNRLDSLKIIKVSFFLDGFQPLRWIRTFRCEKKGLMVLLLNDFFEGHSFLLKRVGQSISFKKTNSSWESQRRNVAIRQIYDQESGGDSKGL